MHSIRVPVRRNPGNKKLLTRLGNPFHTDINDNTSMVRYMTSKTHNSFIFASQYRTVTRSITTINITDLQFGAAHEGDGGTH
jgi:hypothetical protein